ncbi:MAG: putative toxin-antitoxin system toxin component, PIN family [Acidobacteria bacterium]|nr:putative toxin-antitoxin system toxin component, PIN family [Acidobacteriota bacterium]
MGAEFAEVKVVLDTNTVVSALLFPSGRLGRLRSLWTDGRARPLVSTATTNELIRVLAYPKFGLSEEEIQFALAAYLPFTETMDNRSAGRSRHARCRDADDQAFVDLAYSGEVDVLVSGDKDILDLAEKTSFPIETPREFLDRFR